MPRYVYSDELAEEICGRLQQGESLNAICKDAGMPSESTVRGWAADDYQGFSAKYTRARELGFLWMADDILRIADRDEAKCDRDRLRIDTRKWLLSKCLPKVYGERTQTDITQTVTINVAFEDYIRSLTEGRDQKVIDGTVAGEGADVARLPVPLRP
jgi:hypothetical protein